MCAFVCPCAGCGNQYKSLATLCNHFDRRHPREQSFRNQIAEARDRQKDAKYRAKVQSKAIVVNGLNYQAFKSAKFAEMKATNPEMTFGDAMKAISAMWRDAKTGNPTETPATSVATDTEPETESETETETETETEPETETETETETEMEAETETETERLPFSSWMDSVADSIAEMMIEQSVEELKGEPAIESPEPEALPIPTGLLSRITKPTIEHVEIDDDFKPYNMSLIECCKDWKQGGFVHAYRVVFSADELTIRKSGKPNVPYTMEKFGQLPKPCTLGQVKRELETVFDAMCDAWCDYTGAEDFEPTDSELFDDMTEYEDVADDLVNENTIEAFLG